MLILIKSKADEESLKKAAEDLEGYIKFVVDVKRKVLTIGGVRHVDGEQLLLKDGSSQQDLWGGGLDLETSEIDFDSMINIRLNQNNLSREVLAPDLRVKMSEIVNKLIK